MVLDVQASKFELRIDQLGLSDIHGARESGGVALALDLDQPLAKAVLLVQRFQFSLVGIQLDIAQVRRPPPLFSRVSRSEACAAASEARAERIMAGCEKESTREFAVALTTVGWPTGNP